LTIFKLSIKNKTYFFLKSVNDNTRHDLLYKEQSLTECCRSCKYWDKASKKVPIDVHKVPKRGEYIELLSAGKSVKIQAWDWETYEPLRLDEIALLRFCFYKGIVKPWSICNNYLPKLPDRRTLCYSESGCEYSVKCPIYKALTSYIM